MKTIKIIDIFCYISIGENDKIPKKVKWRDSIWEYDDRNQDYVHKESMLFEQNKFIRTKKFLNDEVIILDEEDEFIDIDEKDVYMDIVCLSWDEKQVNELIDNFTRYELAIKKLIQNQKKIIERLNSQK